MLWILHSHELAISMNFLLLIGLSSTTLGFILETQGLGLTLLCKEGQKTKSKLMLLARVVSHKNELISHYFAINYLVHFGYIVSS